MSTQSSFSREAARFRASGLGEAGYDASGHRPAVHVAAHCPHDVCMERRQLGWAAATTEASATTIPPERRLPRHPASPPPFLIRALPDECRRPRQASWKLASVGMDPS